ncbi:uncharacterized protein [Miscanthus floridulus]|uniref:uncharacterized protein n=1 Tax=Miscanthus floridulus TaxID=154761 RepID=UPI003459105A
MAGPVELGADELGAVAGDPGRGRGAGRECRPGAGASATGTGARGVGRGRRGGPGRTSVEGDGGRGGAGGWGRRRRGRDAGAGGRGPLKEQENLGFEYSGAEDPSHMVPALELTDEEVLERLQKMLKGASVVPLTVSEFSTNNPPPTELGHNFVDPIPLDVLPAIANTGENLAGASVTTGAMVAFIETEEEEGDDAPLITRW